MSRIMALSLFFLVACNPEIPDDGTGGGMVGQNKGDYERFLKGKPLRRDVQKAAIPAKGLHIPAENLVEAAQPPVPDLETEDLARAFINGVSGGDAQKALAFVLPVELTVRIKDLHMVDVRRARAAAKELAGRRRRAVARRVARLIKKGRMREGTFESIALGSCVWVAKGEDWNRVAFWRCKKSTLYYHVEGERRFLRISEMINWGKRWYIVSL